MPRTVWARVWAALRPGGRAPVPHPGPGGARSPRAGRPIPLAVAALVAAVLAPAPATAEVPGQGAAAFEAAVADWLAEDEAAALPELSRLATDGNAAARVLLALIDKKPALQGPWLSRLSRQERQDVMRAPGGMSGRSWMHEAAGQTPLAGMWLSLWRVDAPMQLVLDFGAAGESRAAREALVALAVRERRGFADIADAPDYPPALRYLVWREWQSSPEQAARAAAEVSASHPGDPQRGQMGAPPPPEALARWLLEAPEAAPIAALCTDRCGAAPADCALAAYGALGSDRALLVFGSPSQTLIPAGDFNASPKGQAALLRRMLLSVDARGRRAQMAAVEAQDDCLAGLLQAEAQRYMIKRE